MNAKIIFSLLFLLTVNVLHAQQERREPAFNTIAFLAWDISTPQNDFVKKTSTSGGTFGYRKMLKNGNVSVGADVSWNSYYEYAPKQTYHLTNGDVTTDLYKYLYTLPLSLNTHYYFKAGKSIHPYVGVALGATYADEQLYYNSYVTEDDQWGFLVRPEAGALIKLGTHSGWAILAGIRYSYSTNKQDEFKIDNLSSIGYQLGIALGY